MKTKLHVIVGNIILAGLALLTAAMAALICMVLSQDVQAQVRFTDKCEFFKQGWRDGYCVDVDYMCVAPVAPYCNDWQYDTAMEAYHAGYEKAQERRRVLEY